MADMQRTGGVGADELHLHLTALAGGGAAIGCIAGGDGRQAGLPGGWGDEEVDEARPGDFGAGQQAFPVIQVGDQQFGQLAGRLLLRFGQLHGHVTGKVAMFFVGRDADGDRGKRFRQKGRGFTGLFQGLRNQCSKFLADHWF